ncbi:CPXCG motif-containing cysteine-rich protein [Marinobacterium aestuariivivens]|uniref:CPXCG motif-containing cysteine-rich protein n=1 Tax=Marinobacterium aestuariivivens TaxID=1698799 RepID=A0ABW2A171_9GAMM
MNTLEEVDLYCPYCGEHISVLVDCSEAEQQYVEDCQVCCSPMLLSVNVDGSGLPMVDAARENE